MKKNKHKINLKNKSNRKSKLKRKDLTKAINTPPGSMIYVGKDRFEDITLKYIEYNKDEYYEKDIENIDNISNLLDFSRDKGNEKVNWISIIGIHEADKISSICKPLNLHPLVVEDILDTTQRPKIEDYDDYLFIIVKRMYYTENKEIWTEQMSFLLFKNLVVSFQEFESDTFKNIKNRLKEGGTLRKNMADDLLYSLLDNIVDDYFLLLEEIGEKTDILEDELLIHPDNEILQKIYILKRDLIYIRNNLWPMRNVTNNLSKDQYDLIDGKTVYYMRDMSDNVIQIIDLIEIYREICSGMLDTYLSSIGNKTNEVMKVLTIFSTIFIPLTFVAGVYGMNFDYIPELRWKYSYNAFWILSLSITGVMLRYFKKKNWF